MRWSYVYAPHGRGMDWLGVWPGREPGGDDTRGSAEPGGRGGYGLPSTLDPVAYCFIYEWNPVATWSLNFNIENFTEGMAILCTAGEHR